MSSATDRPRKLRGRYKKYLEPNAQCEIPKSSIYEKKRRIEQELWGNVESSSGDSAAALFDTEYQTNDSLQNGASATPSNGSDIDEETFGNPDIDEDTSGEPAIDEAIPSDETDIDEAIPSKESDIDEDTSGESDIDEDTYSVFENLEPGSNTPVEREANDDYIQQQREINVNDDTSATDDPYLNESLCPCTPTTQGEAILAVMTLGVRHSFTWTAIIDTLKTINALLGKDALPVTKYKLFKYFAEEKDYFRYNIICPSCDRFLGRQANISANQIKVCKCGTSVKPAEMESFFLTASFENQLKDLLKRPDIAQNLNYRFTTPSNPTEELRDIYDGNVYRKMTAAGKPLSYEYNLSYTFNTDGCQATNSSKTSLWPIYVVINELPPHIRNQNMILVGVWACNRKPNMATFLQPFVDDAQELSDKGITCELNSGGIVTSKIFPICSSVDSVARSAMLNMKQFNGYYGCTLCEHPGELVTNKAGNKVIKYTVSTQIPPDRTHQSIVRNMELAHEKTATTKMRRDIKGVFGPSPLMNLRHFDLGNGLPPDSMHLLAGLMEQYTNILLTESGNDFYIGSPSVFSIIDERLTSFKPPKCITRTPRSLLDRAQWKASEWRSWLIFYALVCLNGILPKKYLTHLAMLATAIHILMEEKISRDKLEYANKLLIKFVILFQAYFGKAAMNYNVHLLLHLCRSVENFGPLWTHNTYSFENENRNLLQLKKSPTQLALQICRRFIAYQKIPAFSTNFRASRRIKEFCQQLSENRVKFYFKTETCTLIGSGKSCSLTAEEEECLGYKVRDCISYGKIISGKFRFTSTQYERTKKTNSNTVITKNGTFGIITNICKIPRHNPHNESTVIIFFRKIELIRGGFIKSSDVSVTHVKKCRAVNAGPLLSCSPESLHAPCILMQTSYGNFVSTIPRGCLGD